MPIRRFVIWTFSVGLVSLGIGVVCAQEYPIKPIRIFTGGVGGGNDFVSRVIATALSGPIGQAVIVENRGGSVASSEAVSKAPPDGYTLLLTGGALWLTPLLQKMPFDVVRDFLPITATTRETTLLIVNPSLPVKSVKELIALAKARPGELNHTIASIGTTSHLAWESFKRIAGVRMEAVAYKSDSQEMADLISGYVSLTFNGGPKVGPHIKSGKLRALAVTSARPSTLYPDLPTVALTLPGFEFQQIAAIFVPAKTPEAISNRLNQEIVRVLTQTDVKKKLMDASLEVVGSSTQQLGDTVRGDIAKWGALIKDLGIRAD